MLTKQNISAAFSYLVAIIVLSVVLSGCGSMHSLLGVAERPITPAVETDLPADATPAEVAKVEKQASITGIPIADEALGVGLAQIPVIGVPLAGVFAMWRRSRRRKAERDVLRERIYGEGSPLGTAKARVGSPDGAPIVINLYLDPNQYIPKELKEKVDG